MISAGLDDKKGTANQATMAKMVISNKKKECKLKERDNTFGSVTKCMPLFDMSIVYLTR